jgi:cytochrome P450
MDVHEAALFVISPDGHTDDDGLQKAFALLRAVAPVFWCEPPGVRPLWLITRHADVMAVERKGAPFAAAPRSFLSSEAGEASMRQVSGKPDVLRGLVQMDDPDHAIYRDIALPWFTSTGLSDLESWITHFA